MWWIHLQYAAVAFPYNLRSVAFPESESWNGMKATGAYDPSIFDANTNRITCGNREGMIAVFASASDSVSSATRYTKNDDWNRYDINIKSDWGTGVSVSFANSAAKSLKVMCAKNEQTWRYTAFSSIRAHYNPFIRPPGSVYADVAIIGSGVGGLGVAAALADKNIKVTVVSPGLSASTSAQSTGVVWFPNASKHSVDMLKKAYGAPQNDTNDRIAAYINHGTAAYAYWDTKLDLAPFSSLDHLEYSYDYTVYPNGEIQGNSYQSKLCFPAQASLCGSTLTQRLNSISQPQHVYDSATNVEKTPSQEFNIFLQNSDIIIFSTILVIATGGDGVSSTEFDSDVILAFTNNGFARKVQEQLQLTPAGTDSFYHLEFQSPDNGVSWAQRWFANDTCGPSPSVPDYDLCYDYSRRAQTLPRNHSHATTNVSYNCSTGHGRFWKTYIQTAYSYTAYPSCAPLTKLKAGIIDSKAGFELDQNYESIDEPRLFASGTAAAAFTKDAYFAPGATLGLGLTTGHRIAQIIPQRLDAFKKAQQGTSDGMIYRQCKAPHYFIAGAWTGVVGILAHRSQYRIIKNLHYILMPLAVILITIGVVVARDCLKQYVKQYGNNGTYHYYAGYTLLGLLWAQVVLGSAHKVHMTFFRKEGSSNYVGQIHRITGAFLIILIAVQYLTVLYPRYSYVMQNYKHNHPAAGIVFTVIAGLYVLYAIIYRITEAQTQQIFTQDFFADKARLL